MYTNERNYFNHILSHGNSMSDLNSVYMCEYFQTELQTIAQGSLTLLVHVNGS